MALHGINEELIGTDADILMRMTLFALVLT